MKTLRLVLTAVAVAALAASTAPGSAAAVGDNTPPVLRTPLKASFVAGTALAETKAGDLYFYTVPERIRWSGSDDSGTVYYNVWTHFAGDYPELTVQATRETSVRVAGSDYVDQQGGGAFAATHWSIEAMDSSGNGVQRAVYGVPLVVTQDDGRQTDGYQTTDVVISYRGAWRTARCDCFASGSTRTSSAAGAQARIAIRVPESETVRSYAVVMETAPNRGKARVVVDGKRVRTIDTYAATPTHQMVVFVGSLSTGRHVVRIVNLATPGRSRIDLDAVVVN